MAEWLKAHAWKACLGETLTWVRIPLAPPYFRSKYCYLEGIWSQRPGILKAILKVNAHPQGAIRNGLDLGPFCSAMISTSLLPPVELDRILRQLAAKACQRCRLGGDPTGSSQFPDARRCHPPRHSLQNALGIFQQGDVAIVVLDHLDRGSHLMGEEEPVCMIVSMLARSLVALSRPSLARKS